MDMSKKEFQEEFKKGTDQLLEYYAYQPSVDPDKYYTMICLLENLTFFSPVIFDLMKPVSKDRL